MIGPRQASAARSPAFRRRSLIPLVVGLTLATPLHSQIDLTTEQWREDLRSLHGKLADNHSDPFHTTSRVDLERAIHDLDQRLPALENNQVVVEMARIVGMVGDGHTVLWLLPGIVNGHSGFRRLPLAMHRFADGWFVIGAAEPQSAALGGRILAIEGVEIEDVFGRLAPLAPRDNAMTLLDQVPRLMITAEVLHALGITASPDRASLTVERNGEAVDVSFPAIEADRLPSFADLRFDHPEAAAEIPFLTARDESAAPALWLRHPPSLWFRKASRHYWLAYLEGSKTLYVQISRNESHDDEPMDRFFARMFEVADTREVDRLVLDLRLHGGGDNTLSKPLIRGILARPQLDRPGRLFTIIGRRTFSAGSHLVTQLETWTNTLFVGEPTGGSPNHHADNRGSRLPHSRLAVHTSTMYWQNALPVPFEDRDTTAPDLPAPMAFADYRGNRDPALAAILSYRHRPLTNCGIRRPQALCRP